MLLVLVLELTTQRSREVAVTERALLKNSCYVIPIGERLRIFALRLVLIPYLILRYKMRRFIPTDMENSGDVVRKYIRDYEAEKG